MNTCFYYCKATSVHAMLCYAKLLQSLPTLCDPRDGSSPGSPVPGILQARTLEWVVISFSSAWKWKVKVKSLSHIQLLATHGLHPTRLLCPWDFPGKSTGVGCHCLLRQVFIMATNTVHDTSHSCLYFCWLLSERYMLLLVYSAYLWWASQVAQW